MFSALNYLNNIAITPKEQYEGLNQATINKQWDNTTQLQIIKEQVAYPFKDEYVEYECWVDAVSDNIVNTTKVYSDFVEIMFQDLNHKQNYKGQYYKLKSTNGVSEETYICYDRMNALGQIPTFKCVRCNNILTWINSEGEIVTMPCYLGSDITSTNNLISKDGISPNERMIIFVQANEETMKIVRNQRFLFQHSNAFKVEEVNNYIQEEGTDGQVTSVKIYVDYSSLTPQDNVELNVCNYYKTIENQKTDTLDKKILVSPFLSELRERQSVVLDYGVYLNEELQSDTVLVSISGIPNDCYEFDELTKTLTIKKYTPQIMNITFSCIDCAEDVSMDIKIRRLL